MKEFIKGRGWVQWVSLITTIVLLAIGILSAFVPELAVVGQNLEAYLFALGLVIAPGILSKGKAVGENAKNLLYAKESKIIEGAIKSWQKKLDELTIKYADVIEIAKNVKEIGGALTIEQKALYEVYLTQKQLIEAKIETEKKKLKVSRDI